MPEDNRSTQDLLDDASGHIAIGELDEALALYHLATVQSPQDFDAWHSYAMVLMKTDRLKEAIGAGMMATTLRPNDLLAWTALSQIYVKSGQIAEAEDAKGKARILSLGGKVVKD